MQTDEMEGGAPHQSGSHLLVEVWVVAAQPGEPLDGRQVRLIRDVEPKSLMVVPREQHDYWLRLLSDGPKAMPIQCPGSNRDLQRGLPQVQLCGHLLADKIGIGPKV